MSQAAPAFARIDQTLNWLVAVLSDSTAVERIWLFGSRARGSAGPRSDIDVAVFAPRASMREWERLLGRIDEVPTLLKVDCVRLDALPADDPLRSEIEREGRVLFELGAATTAR